MISRLFANQHLLFDIIQSRLALTLDEHRGADVLRTVEELIAAGELRHMDDAVALLTQQPLSHWLWEKFIRIATINETYFFRDRSQLNALQYTVLPALIEERRRQNRLQLRLWSAGCSSGEEPYSLAIMLQELLPDFSAWGITILATDLNAANLERARSGLYRSWSFRSETPLAVRQRWFTPEADGFRIDRSIRQMVTFGQLNLASGDYPSITNGTMSMDLILCRNMLIYFDNQTVADVIGRFHGALTPDGWLVLGHSESGHMTNQDFEPRNFENAVLYRKGARPIVRETPVRSATGTLPPLSTRLPKTAPLAKTGTLSSLSSASKTGPLSKTGTLSSRLPKTAPLSTRLPRTAPLAPPSQVDPLEQARRAADAEQWAEALRWLSEAEMKHKLSPEVHYLRGVVEIQQQEIDKGIASLRRALYCDNTFAMAHFALGEVYEKQSNYRKASSEWSQAQIVLAYLRPEDPVACGGDLTVEMLRGLVQFRLDNLPNKG